MALPRRWMRIAGLGALFLAAALFGVASGVLFSFSGDLPQISALDDYTPQTISRVLGEDGAVVGEFANERRVIVTYDQVPEVLRNAIISAEDKNFFKHHGLDVPAIAKMVARRALFMQRAGGASTITQELARQLFLTNEQTIQRKMKEWLLALRIEKRYTKQEILTMYCNKIYFGEGAYGVEAASQVYFGKHASELKLGEAAMLAGIIQGNQRQSPYRDMKTAVARRNYVLDRMAANGYIPEADAAATKKTKIVTIGLPTTRSIAPYFLETLRTQLDDRYGTKALYENGLTIKTGLDLKLQAAANRALDLGLRRLDKEKGVFRKPAHNILAEGRTLENYRNTRWNRDPVVGDITPAVVVSTAAGVIRVMAGSKWQGTIAAKDGYDWTHKKPDALVREGDLIEVRIQTLDPKAGLFTASLEQAPQVQGAVLAIDNHTGEVRAMVGGEDFSTLQFNLATQAMRQVGSTAKAFVYTAAIDRGYTTVTPLDDKPVSYNPGPNQPPYEPKNFDHQFKDVVSLREALEDSRNVPTIGLMDKIGPANVIDYAHRFGITPNWPPYLPVAIGAGEDTLWEMTSAYTAFPNGGIRMTPTSILEVTDRDGNVLEEHHPEPHVAVRADTAYIMTDLFRGVIKHGTGAGAADLDWPLGGKTGTTDEATDAWFIGFDPDITIGVWVGYLQKKPLGGSTAQAAIIALPIWKDIMTTWIDRRRKELPEPPDFTRPGNIVIVMTATGPEPFIAGTEPGGGG